MGLSLIAGLPGLLNPALCNYIYIYYSLISYFQLTGSCVVDGIVQMIAEHDVIENVDHEAREEQVAHVEYGLVVFVRHRFVHQRVTADEIQHGIYKRNGHILISYTVSSDCCARNKIQ